MGKRIWIAGGKLQENLRRHMSGDAT